MSAPPAKKSKVKSASRSVDAPKEEEECSTISIVVGKGDCLSPITRIKGYPWRFRLVHRNNRNWKLFVKCEKSMEAELWECEADISYSIDSTNFAALNRYKFESKDKKNQERPTSEYISEIREGSRVEVNITPTDNGKKWRSRPDLGPFAPRDGCLLIEDTKLHVNKESLASQSSYFDRLFNGDFKEKNMTEIPIGDISVEEFTNLMKMVYGENNTSVVDRVLTSQNVGRILELADRFGLKIVEDGVVNVLLSSSSSFSIHERLLIADKQGLSKCKDEIISQYDKNKLKEVSKAPEYGQLSMDTKDALFKRACEFFR